MDTLFETLQKIIDAQMTRATQGDYEAAHIVIRAVELQAKVKGLG